MNKYFLLLFFYYLFGRLFSQNNEIGVSLLAFSSINTNNIQQDTLFRERQNSIINLQPVLTYNYINLKGLDFNIQLGYFYIARNLKDGKTNDKLFVYYNRNKHLQKSVYIKLGIAKRFTKDRILLITGINIPFEYCYFKEDHNYTDAYTIKNDTLVARSELYDKYAPEYTTGINLQQSVYYSLSKHILIGIDLNLGLRALITHGVRNRKENTINYQNPGTNYSLDEYATYKYSLQTNLYFQPSLSIKYNFQKK